METGLASSIRDPGHVIHNLQATLQRWRPERPTGGDNKHVMAREVGEQMAQQVSEGLGTCSPHLERVKAMFAHSWSQQRAC